jgi:tripartite-type tricarboxylate transporter receptor subunit TctC
MGDAMRFVAALLLSVVMSGAHAAQPYPSGPIRWIVPFPPGGGTDILARTIGQKLSEAWGVPVLIDNRGGANGTIGAAMVAKAPPDGQTLLIVPSGFAVNPSIYKNLPFDSVKDLAPVSQLAAGPLVLVVHPSFPPKNVKELVTFIKARPDSINYGSSGNGSPPHLATELFKLMTGTKMMHIPYKGAGPAAVDVIAGQIPVYFMNALQAVPHLKSGRARSRSDDGYPLFGNAGDSDNCRGGCSRLRHEQLVWIAGAGRNAPSLNHETAWRGRAYPQSAGAEGALDAGRG